MLLEDATSKAQVQRALAAGDEELREDIEEKLDAAMRWWDERGLSQSTHADEEPIGDFSMIAESESFVDALIEQSPAAYDLGNIPRADVEQEAYRAARNERRRRNGLKFWGPFTVTTERDSDDGFSYRVGTTDSTYFPETRLPEGAEYIPPELARAFWKSLDGKVDWEQTDRVEENWGHLAGEPVYITASNEDWNEWCRDLVAGYVSNVITERPDEAKAVFFAALEKENSALAAKVRAAQLPDEELLDFVVKWFEGEDEREEIYQTLKAHFEALESGVDEPREVIGEWTQADLREMGITRGPLYEEAPWKLIKLHPADLRLEGALMRHCVGEKGMGYIQALKNDEIEVWSLRSRANKPRFTLEVDTQLYAEDIREQMAAHGDPQADEELRAENIKQLKGKANRTPGYADARQTGGIKFPDEVTFWIAVFRRMGVDPAAVADLRPAFDETQTLETVREFAERGAFGRPPTRRPQVEPNDGDVCTGFDMPYRPLR